MGIAKLADSLVESLKHDWCEAFEAYPIGPDEYSLGTPFSYNDGDGYPVIVRCTSDGWELTDHGEAFDVLPCWYELTDARLRALTRTLRYIGVNLDHHRLSLVCDQFPTVERVAQFITAIDAVRNLPADVTETTSTTFKTRASMALSHHLATGRNEPNWAPPFELGSAWPADLMIPAAGEAKLTMFFVSTSERAERVTSTMFRYRQETHLNLIPRVIAPPDVLRKGAVSRIIDASRNPDVIDYQAGDDTPAETLEWIESHGVPVR